MSIKKVTCSALIPMVLAFLFSCGPGSSTKKGTKDAASQTNVAVQAPTAPDTAKNPIAPVIPSADEQKGPVAEKPQTNATETVKPANSLPAGAMGEQEILSIKTDEDIQSLENRIAKMTDAELNQTIANLEKAESEAAVQGKSVPAIHVALSVCYGRKGLIDRAYSAIVQAERAAQAPGVVFSLSAVYGRKELLASNPALSPCSMVLQSDPPGARMKVDDVDAGIAPSRAEGLRPGPHTVTAELRGYMPYQTSVEGNLGETLTIEARLSPRPVVYTLTIKPDVEMVTLDGNPLDPSAHRDGLWSGEVLPGPHRIEARLQGYQDLGSDIRVPLGPEPYQTSFSLKALPSTLNVNSNPEGAGVILGGKNIGTTPLRYQTLDFGEKELDMVSNDWRYGDPVPQKIVFGPGADLSVSQDLERKVGSFSLPVGPSMPVGAAVRLNGQAVGTVPIVDKALQFGDYTIEITSPPYERLIQTIRWQGNPEAIPRALKKPYQEVPVRTIKIDGNLDDWAGLDPILTDPAGNDKMPKEPGTDVTALYVAHDDKNLYWRIDFADGKPQWSAMALDDNEIYCDLVFNNLTYNNVASYQLDLRVGMNKNGRYFNLYQLHRGESRVAFSENVIIYKIGASFLEARIPLSTIQKFLGGIKPVRVRVYTGPQKVSTYMIATKQVDIQTDFKGGRPIN